MFGQYTEEMKMMSFKELIHGIIEEKLDEFEGRSIYASDLANEITMEDNINGTMFVYTEDSKQFINDHSKQAEETYEYFKDLGIEINPYSEPDKYAFLIESYGVETELNHCQFIIDHWNEEIELTQETIKEIKEGIGIETMETKDIEVLYGYVYNDDGMHGEPIIFENTPDNISMFIMNNQPNSTVITDELDNFVVSSTVGGFLDRVRDSETREQILDSILPYQYGERVSPNFPIEESFVKIDDKTVYIQVNSDKDFDYTIYDSNKNEIDGGIIDNIAHLDSIPDYVNSEIKQMHNLTGNEERLSIYSTQLEEAIDRMDGLRLNKDLIDDLQEGNIWQSDENGNLYKLSAQQDINVLEFENNNRCTVYHVVHGNYEMSDGTVMEMDNYLYVSDSIQEWKEDREMLKEGFTFCYVNNLTYPEMSEFGEIGVAPRDGGLIRQDRGYDFSVMSVTDLANKIDQYKLYANPLSYIEAEHYQGANRDSIFAEVNSGKLDNEITYFKNEADNNELLSGQAKEILSDIDAYLNSLENNIKFDDDIDMSHGMSM